jgi:hypothetical protein
MRNRAEFLKAEIQKFLRDKKLLRELEDGDFQTPRSVVSSKSNAIHLLRQEIFNRSGQVEAWCAELKTLKTVTK